MFSQFATILSMPGFLSFLTFPVCLCPVRSYRTNLFERRLKNFNVLNPSM